MSLRKRVETIAREVARETALQLIATRFQQIQNSNSSVGKIISADGVNLKLQMSDGSTKNAKAGGNRNVGQGSTGITVGGVFL